MQRHISRPPVLPGSPGFARTIAVIQLFVLTRIQFVGDPTDVRLALMEESRPKDGGVRFVCLFVFILTHSAFLQTSTAIKDANCSFCLSLFDYWPMPCDLWHDHLYCSDAIGGLSMCFL